MEGLSVKNTFIDVCPVDEACSEDSSPRGSPKRNASAPASPSRVRGDPNTSWVYNEHGFENYDVMPPIGSVLRYGANAHMESDEFGLMTGAFEEPFFQPSVEGHSRSTPFGSGMPPPMGAGRAGRLSDLEGLGLHGEVAGQDASSHGASMGEFASAPPLPAYIANAHGEKKSYRNRSRERSQAYGASGRAGEKPAEWLGSYGSGLMDCDSRVRHGDFSMPTYGLPGGPLPTFGSVHLSGMLGDAGDRRPEATRSVGKGGGLEGYPLTSGDAGDRRVEGDARDRRDRRFQPPVYPMYTGAPAGPFQMESHGGGPDAFESWMRDPRDRGRRVGDAGDRATGKGVGRGGGRGGRGAASGGGRGETGHLGPPERGRQQADNRAEKNQPWVAANINQSMLFDDANAAPSKGASGIQGGGGGPKRTDYQKKFGSAGEEADAGGAAAGEAGDRQLVTTVMLKNIPCRKSQTEVMTHIDVSGFSGTYDFFYLPRDTKFRANLGYAFVNFTSPLEAERFSKEMDGFKFPGSESNKACAVVPAHVQGLVNNLSAFKRTEVMRSKRKPYFSPLAAA